MHGEAVHVVFAATVLSGVRQWSQRVNELSWLDRGHSQRDQTEIGNPLVGDLMFCCACCSSALC